MGHAFIECFATARGRLRVVRGAMVWLNSLSGSLPISSMATQPARRRIKFSEVAIGERFYDPISAEYFVKQSETLAAMVSGMGDGTIPDEFEPDDIVGIDLH